jgi:hypothetical protein
MLQQEFSAKGGQYGDHVHDSKLKTKQPLVTIKKGGSVGEEVQRVSIAVTGSV